MYTFTSVSSAVYRDKGSKFLAFCEPVADFYDVNIVISKYKSKYPDASHHCLAWRLNPANVTEFSSDDGEPGGTAGLPILNKMRAAEIVQGMILVVRYYGGTNLGKSGLIKAYGESAQLAIQENSLNLVKVVRCFTVTFPYSESKTFDQLVNRWNLEVSDAKYSEDVRIEVFVDVGQLENLVQQLNNLEYAGFSFLMGEIKFISSKQV